MIYRLEDIPEEDTDLLKKTRAIQRLRPDVSNGDSSDSLNISPSINREDYQNKNNFQNELSLGKKFENQEIYKNINDEHKYIKSTLSSSRPGNEVLNEDEKVDSLKFKKQNEQLEFIVENSTDDSLLDKNISRVVFAEYKTSLNKQNEFIKDTISHAKNNDILGSDEIVSGFRSNNYDKKRTVKVEDDLFVEDKQKRHQKQEVSGKTANYDFQEETVKTLKNIEQDTLDFDKSGEELEKLMFLLKKKKEKQKDNTFRDDNKKSDDSLHRENTINQNVDNFKKGDLSDRFKSFKTSVNLEKRNLNSDKNNVDNLEEDLISDSMENNISDKNFNNSSRLFGGRNLSEKKEKLTKKEIISKIKRKTREEQIEYILNLSKERDLDFAVRVAEDLGDWYVLDLVHDRLKI